jgi:hypothetical protein
MEGITMNKIADRLAGILNVFFLAIVSWIILLVIINSIKDYDYIMVTIGTILCVIIILLNKKMDSFLKKIPEKNIDL